MVRLRLVVATAATIGLAAFLIQAAAADLQKSFATPEEAIQATIDASAKNDTPALMQLFGVAGKDIVQSGDAGQDKKDREEFARLAYEKMKVDRDPYTPDRVTFTVGNDDSPFPVPLVKKNGRWEFDSARGRVEILAHRVGTNELTAVDVMRGFVEAEMEYAANDRDADGVLEYAQKIVSTVGKKDGLYWDGAPDTLVPKAFAGAAIASNAAPNGKSEPYHGYHFRILKAQGPDAPGGAMSYVVNGKMIGGFAMVAWPAEYGVSGVQTFIVSHRGVVYGKDLGPTSVTLAKQITTFNPGKGWQKIDE